MPAEVAEHAGFCMGVSRAVEQAEKAARDGVPSCTLGELIHNPRVVSNLADRGLEPISGPEAFTDRFDPAGVCKGARALRVTDQDLECQPKVVLFSAEP